MFFSKLKTKENFFVDGLVEFQNNGLLAKIRGKIPSIVGNKSLFSKGDILRKKVISSYFQIEEESGFFWRIKKLLGLYRVREFVEIKIIDISLIDHFEIIPTNDIESVTDKPDDQKSFDPMKYVYDRFGFWYGDFIKNYEIKFNPDPVSDKYFVTAKFSLDHGLIRFADIDDISCISRIIVSLIRDNDKKDVAYFNNKTRTSQGGNFISFLSIKEIIDLMPSANIDSKPRKKILAMPNDMLYVDKITRNNYVG